MQAAIDLAMRGRGGVEPNPMVGCAIVKDGQIIGRGYHQHYGSAHAEPNALASCDSSPTDATAYVTLEPCCHNDKQTPPCVPRLIEAKVARVVVGCLDPNPKVSGRGIQLLRNAGIAVDVGVCGDACRQLIAPFMAKIKLGRPYVTLKWAETADGKVAGPGGKRLAITGPIANRAVHELRSRCDAILVGINTVLNDNPLLTVRSVPVMRTPLRVVLDSKLRIPLTSRLVQTAAEQPVLVYAFDGSLVAANKLRERGGEVAELPAGKDGLDLSALLEDLCNRGCMHLLVEPGPRLACSFINAKLADRIWRIQSPIQLSDVNAPAIGPPPNMFQHIDQCHLGPDTLTEFLNRKSETFVAPFASADFHLLSHATFPNQAGYNADT